MKKSSADAEGPCGAPYVLNIAFERASNKGMSFKDTQGHRISAIT